MVTRDLIKAEVDKVQEKYLDILYKIIKALIPSSDSAVTEPNSIIGEPGQVTVSAWHSFIAQTYGCLVDDPIERGKRITPASSAELRD